PGLISAVPPGPKSKGSSKDESLDEGIFGVKVELVSTDDRGSSPDLGNNGVVRAKLRGLHDLHRHRTAKDTFNGDSLVQAQLTPGIMQRGASADAGARSRAVNLALGKDTSVSAVPSVLEGRPGKDCAVEKAQLVFEGMRDGEIGHHCLLD